MLFAVILSLQFEESPMRAAETVGDGHVYVLMRIHGNSNASNKSETQSKEHHKKIE